VKLRKSRSRFVRFAEAHIFCLSPQGDNRQRVELCAGSDASATLNYDLAPEKNQDKKKSPTASIYFHPPPNHLRTFFVLSHFALYFRKILSNSIHCSTSLLPCTYIHIIKMGKTKEIKTGSKSKSEVKSLSAVKNASVTKPSQTPNAKSKQIAKETASKVSAKTKPVKKAPTPSSDSESSESESGSDSASETEVKVTKPVNGKANGKTNGAAKKEVATSESSSESSSSSESESESESESDSDEEMEDADSKKPAPASDSDSSDSDSESEEEAAPAKKVNGAAKAAAKATVSNSFIVSWFSTDLYIEGIR
jgi:hypothetical protein